MSCDVIVIGAGIGGLTSAAILAGQGKRVLLLEACDRIGGFQHRFERDGFVFEPNFHFLQDVGAGRPVRLLLDSLGVRQEFHRVDPVARLSFPDGELDIPNDREAFIARLKSEFPGEAEGIDALFAAKLGIYTALTRQQPSPLIGLYGADTVETFVSRFVRDPRLKARAGAWSAYFGYGRGQISALAIAVFTEACWDGGIFHPAGGIGNIERQLQEHIQRFGGEVRLNSAVRRILVHEGRASGVELSDGSIHESRAVVANIDTRSVCDMLADPELGTALAARIEGLERFRSPFCVYLGVKSAGLGLRDGPAVRVDFHGYDSEALDHAQAMGDIDHAPLPLGIPTRYNRELAPPGHDIVILYTFVDNRLIDGLVGDADQGQEFARRLVKRAERIIPGLANNIVVMETSDSATPMLYNANSKGALGWAPTPAMLPRMPDHESPVPGLFLSGQWTRTGAGMNNVFASAQIAASLVIADLGA